jgi:hypothetical protein
MLDGATARECTLTGAGAKAAAEPKRAKERTEKSFIVAMFGLLLDFGALPLPLRKKATNADECGCTTKISLPHRHRKNRILIPTL